MVYLIFGLWVLMLGAICLAGYWSERTRDMRGRSAELRATGDRLRGMVDDRFAEERYTAGLVEGSIEPPDALHPARDEQFDDAYLERHAEILGLDALDEIDEATSFRIAGQLIERTLKGDL